MGRAAIALLAAGIALVAAAARAQSEQRVLAPSVFVTRNLPANAITTFGVTCPAGFVATSAGIARPASGATVLAIMPVGLRTYRFRLGNPATNDKQRITAAAACRRIVGPGQAKYKLRLRFLRSATVTAQPGKAAGATLACPSGTAAAAGAGADLAPNRQNSTQAYRGGPRVSIRRQTSTLSRFSFSVQNAGSQARSVTFYGGCVTLTRLPGAPRERLHLALTTFRVDVRTGSQSFSRRCRRGWFALAAGFAQPSRLTQVEGAVAVGSRGRWSVSSDADSPAPVDLHSPAPASRLRTRPETSS
jgi:hypothetical protein